MTTAITGAGAPPPTNSAGGAAGSQSATSALTSDFETFLRLMTTQAKYQDPLEPMDSSDYTAQLAQFSSVEQQVMTNETLTSMLSALSLSNMSQLTGWVGKEVRAQAAAHFDGSTPVAIAPNPAAVADEVKMVIYDAEENEVGRIDLPVSAEPYQWQGDNGDGETLPEGSYTFVVESYSDDEVILSEVAEVYGRVEETQSVNGEVALILESGSAILASSVTALRDPDADTGSS
ncbi:flagellar hook capping FlgD N-terminal domain-containing protein [Tritonibacter scottomollicae]|uniref:Basal-body rod modification protein FlgD n=1 Tax=Tritonibacter scottomollicae TaxID=483013 RepID=A0ABZ0HCK2_TRISK|nr:flagellar hook capping FlgD N-terminal domain-containing protein [Tritonibacter scottomollicae]WOI32545.1 flagellar hook capping FlgD N-terminal domain-containing protein [Tritonibacter scottomollicae]